MNRSLVAGLVLVSCVGIAGTAGRASAQVVIQGEGQAGGVYGQGTVYVQGGQTQQVQASPYVAGPVQQPQPVRTVVHTRPMTALLIPGVIALAGGWLLHGIISTGVWQNTSGAGTWGDVDAWAGLGWIPVAGPWLAYGLTDTGYYDYGAFNIIFGVIQGAGLILTILGAVIQEEWEEQIYADLGGGMRLSVTGGPTSLGAALEF